MRCLIHVDGGARGNPGPAAAGVVIRDADTEKYLHEAGYWLGEMTNNSAEYHGLLHALRAAAKLNADALHIHSDSELMVKQINGEYRVKSPHLRELCDEARKLLRGFDQWKMTHVRRDKNKLADELANRAMDAGADVVFSSE